MGELNAPPPHLHLPSAARVEPNSGLLSTSLGGLKRKGFAVSLETGLKLMTKGCRLNRVCMKFMCGACV